MQRQKDVYIKRQKDYKYRDRKIIDIEIERLQIQRQKDYRYKDRKMYT